MDVWKYFEGGTKGHVISRFLAAAAKTLVLCGPGQLESLESHLDFPPGDTIIRRILRWKLTCGSLLFDSACDCARCQRLYDDVRSKDIEMLSAALALDNKAIFKPILDNRAKIRQEMRKQNIVALAPEGAVGDDDVLGLFLVMQALDELDNGDSRGIDDFLKDVEEIGDMIKGDEKATEPPPPSPIVGCIQVVEYQRPSMILEEPEAGQSSGRQCWCSILFTSTADPYDISMFYDELVLVAKESTCKWKLYNARVAPMQGGVEGKIGDYVAVYERVIKLS